MDASSIESSEDWENSVNSSELDVQYQSDEERGDNEVHYTVSYIPYFTFKSCCALGL